MDSHAPIASGGAPWLNPKRLPARGRRAGVTLIEAMVVLVIVGIGVATALPGFGRLLSYSRAAGATNDFVHALSLARGEALRRNRRVYVAPTGAHWHDGWAVFVDRNDNRVFDGAVDELIFRHGPLPTTITLVNPANPPREPFTDVGSPQRTYVLFDGSGHARWRNGGLLVGSMAVTDITGKTQTVRTICLAAYGRVRIVADRAACS
jgi:type IV fimbrial biogenesis protein FimT